MKTLGYLSVRSADIHSMACDSHSAVVRWIYVRNHTHEVDRLVEQNEHSKEYELESFSARVSLTVVSCR